MQPWCTPLSGPIYTVLRHCPVLLVSGTIYAVTVYLSEWSHLHCPGLLVRVVPFTLSWSTCQSGLIYTVLVYLSEWSHLHCPGLLVSVVQFTLSSDTVPFYLSVWYNLHCPQTLSQTTCESCRIYTNVHRSWSSCQSYKFL